MHISRFCFYFGFTAGDFKRRVKHQKFPKNDRTVISSVAEYFFSSSALFFTYYIRLLFALFDLSREQFLCLYSTALNIILLLLDGTWLFLYTFFAKVFRDICGKKYRENWKIKKVNKIKRKWRLSLSNLQHLKQILMLRFTVLYFFFNWCQCSHLFCCFPVFCSHRCSA